MSWFAVNLIQIDCKPLYVLRVGLDTQVNDRLGLGLSYDNGRSNDCFVDCPDDSGDDQPGACFGLTADSTMRYLIAA